MTGDTQITLPPGWTVTAGRETVQTNSAGQNVQGLNFTLSNPAVASNITVFIPYSLMSQTAAVAQIFASRINAVTAITSLGS